MDKQSKGTAEHIHPTGTVHSGEARFRAVVDGFSDPILIIDTYHIVRYVNTEFLTVFGYTLADVIGRPFDELLPPEERAAIPAELARYQEAPESTLRFEHRLCRHDEVAEIVETSANTLIDPSGQLTIILHVRVITERKRAEETLRASEERYRLLVENSHDLIQSVTPDGRFLFVNSAWLKTLEYGEADLPNLNLWDIVHIDSRAAYERASTALWHAQNIAVMRAIFVTRRGAAVEVEGIAVVQIEQGQPAAINTFFRDITEQHQNARVQATRFAVTRILAESPELDVGLTQAVEAIAVNLDWQVAELWLPDELSQVLYRRNGWNLANHPELDAFADASRHITFARNDGLPGCAWATGEVIWEANTETSHTFRRPALAAQAQIRTAVAIPIVQGYEVVGVMLFFSLTAHPRDEPLADILADLGRQLGQFAARKQAETALESERASLARRVEERTADLSRVNAELARAVRAKDEFLANMSHELRTPLNTVLALSETLLEQFRGPLNEHQQGMVRNIEASGQHLLALINDILDLAKIEAERLDLEREPVAVADICQASLMFVKELALKKQLHLAFHLSDQLAMMEADPKRLKQMLVNLLSNAVKFTPAGGKVSLEVEIRAEQSSIYFTVQDSGIGISQEDQARLFKPFTQLDSSLRRQHEGTGLGLALVWRLVELHGGSINIESEPGHGSRFTIALPYYPSASVGRADSDTHAPIVAPQRTGAPGLALIIDDSESAAEQLARYLQSMNMRVVVHLQGEGVLEQVLKLRPQVILLDLLMPDQSGWEILAQLKADPQTRDIPVIIVSVVDAQTKALAAGAAAYIVKPLSREALRSALRAATIAEAKSQEPASASERPPDPTHARILLAEDNESTIEVISDYLSNRGYHVIVARNGREAFDQTIAARPDMILMDIQMPEIDGLEVMRHLRAEEAFATTPILALTALAMPGDRERCLAAGANEYMTKPVGLKKLLETIQRMLGKSES